MVVALRQHVTIYVSSRVNLYKTVFNGFYIRFMYKVYTRNRWKWMLLRFRLLKPTDIEAFAVEIMLRKDRSVWNYHKAVYEWNPINGIWYRIHRRNLVFHDIPPHVQRDVFNAMFGNQIIKCVADYSRPQLHIHSVSLSPASVPVYKQVSEQKNAAETAVLIGATPADAPLSTRSHNHPASR